MKAWVKARAKAWAWLALKIVAQSLGWFLLLAAFVLGTGWFLTVCC